jgi:hypothetical protein
MSWASSGRNSKSNHEGDEGTDISDQSLGDNGCQQIKRKHVRAPSIEMIGVYQWLREAKPLALASGKNLGSR